MQSWKVYVREHPQYGTWYRRVEGRPGWVWKWAVGAALLVIVVPLILITLAAVAVGALVFLVLGAVASVLRLFSSSPRHILRPPSGNDGRENVRIIDP